MIKLTLGAKALSALIGDDEEVRLELLKGAVALFGKRYLKEVVASEAFKAEVRSLGISVRDAFKAEIPVQVRREWSTLVSSLDSSEQAVRLKELMEQLVKKLVDKHLRLTQRDVTERLDGFSEDLESRVKTHVTKLTDRLPELIDKRLTVHVNHHIDKEVRRRLKELGATSDS